MQARGHDLFEEKLREKLLQGRISRMMRVYLNPLLVNREIINGFDAKGKKRTTSRRPRAKKMLVFNENK